MGFDSTSSEVAKGGIDHYEANIRLGSVQESNIEGGVRSVPKTKTRRKRRLGTEPKRAPNSFFTKTNLAKSITLNKRS